MPRICWSGPAEYPRRRSFEVQAPGEASVNSSPNRGLVIGGTTPPTLHQTRPRARASPRGAGLPVGPHGSPPPGEVRDAPLLPVAQAHHVELADAVALRAVDQPLAVGRSRRVVVHRPRWRLGQL